MATKKRAAKKRAAKKRAAAKKPGLPDIAVHPHDGIVKFAFSKREHAKGLLMAILPRAITGAVSWRTLKLDRETFVDPDLRKHYADLLFLMRIRGVEVRVYVLLEHQRKVDKRMMLRLLIYMTRVWKRAELRAPHGDKLPPIVPVLLHNSKHGWTAATSFEALIDLPEVARDDLLAGTPRFSATLVDLSPKRASAIAEEWLTAFGRLVLWALSVAGDDERFLAEIERLDQAIHEAIEAEDDHEALLALLRYISATHERVSVEQFKEVLTAAVVGESQEKVMTLLEKFHVEGAAALLLAQLADRFGTVPAAAKAKVMAADEATLQRWGCRLLKEATLDAVLDSPKPKAAKKASPAARGTRAASRT